MSPFDLNNPKLPDWVKDNAFSSGNYPYENRLGRKEYETTLRDLQIELVKLQAWQKSSGQRIIVVFEGRDAAGKGGTINALRSYMNQRRAKTVALSKPTESERGQWYFQRYIEHFPTSSEIIMFDRSWYNRGGVEPVMGFCSEEQNEKFLRDTPRFEQMIVDEGIIFIKFWLNVGQEMQLKRFHDRQHNPLKVWKISPIDIKAIDKWDAYTHARDQVFAKTHSSTAPWTIIRSNDKRRARINAIRHVLTQVHYDRKDPNVIGELDPNIIGTGPGFLNKSGA